MFFWRNIHRQTEKKGLGRSWSSFCTFFAMKCASRSSSSLLLCCGLFCADTVLRLFVVVAVFSLSVLFVAEWFSTSCTERAFCFWDQYFVADCTGFKIAGSYGKLLLFSADHAFHRQCSSYHRHSWPAWGNRSRNLWLEEFSIPLVHLRSLSVSLSPCLWNIINERGFFRSFLFAEISTRNESYTRSLHRRLSAQHHTWIQWPMGHSCQVMKAACLLTCIKVFVLDRIDQAHWLGHHHHSCLKSVWNTQLKKYTNSDLSCSLFHSHLIITT